MAAHAQGKVRAAIGRAPTLRSWRRQLDDGRASLEAGSGKQVEWLDRLDQPHAMTFVGDFARGLIVLGAQDHALGQVWHIPVAEALTGLQYITLASDVAGIPAKPTTLSAGMLRLVSLNPIVSELVEMMYEYSGPYLMDGSKYIESIWWHSYPTPGGDADTDCLVAERGGALARA